MLLMRNANGVWAVNLSDSKCHIQACSSFWLYLSLVRSLDFGGIFFADPVAGAVSLLCSVFSHNVVVRPCLDLRGLFASIVWENLFLVEGAVQRELGKIIFVTINLFFTAQVCLLTGFCMQVRHACSLGTPTLWYDRSFL